VFQPLVRANLDAGEYVRYIDITSHSQHLRQLHPEHGSRHSLAPRSMYDDWTQLIPIYLEYATRTPMQAKARSYRGQSGEAYDEQTPAELSMGQVCSTRCGP
jgi:hypothetical protein